MYYKVTNIKYFLQHDIHDMHTAYSISCTPLYTHKVHTTVVDFLHPIAQKAKKVGWSNVSNKAGSRLNRGETMAVVSPISLKVSIPKMVDSFKAYHLQPCQGIIQCQWWFAILVLWKSILSAPDRLGKRQPTSHNIRWEKYITSMAQQKYGGNYWEINWSQNQIHH